MTIYSFKDLGAFTHPLGTYIFGGGNVGLGSVAISMATDRTDTDKSADGSIMLS
jgi:hypothetical protein